MDVKRNRAPGDGAPGGRREQLGPTLVAATVLLQVMWLGVLALGLVSALS